MMRALIIFFLALLVVPAFAETGPERLSNPALEARAVALQKQLRCLVCRGESLDDSGAPLAADLRKLIRARILAGETDEAIERYLVGRYGDFILMKPPLQSGTWLLWFGPALVVLLGAGVAALVIVRAGRKTKVPTA